jgi:hypothetical protein
MEDKRMNNEKGISTWAVILIVALLIGAAVLWSHYYAKPMATVMMQGADQAKPAIQKAEQAKATMDRVTQSSEDVAKKANDEAEKK